MALKNVYISELERGWEKVIAFFFAYPEMQTLTELCKKLGISKVTAKETVKILEKDKFLEIKTVGRAWIIKANQNHFYFTSKKIAQNLMHVYESNVLEAVYKEVPNAKAVILFGSYRKGDDWSESDLDIAAEVPGDRQLEIIDLGVIEQFGYRKKVKVKLHVFSRTSININVFASIANGIVLDGFLEVRK